MDIVAPVGHFYSCAPEYANNYRDISYRDNLALSYRIDSQYYGFMIIVFIKF